MGQIVFLLFYFFIFSPSIKASVVLNEVAIQPNQVVELYNTASTSADISSWYIDDSGGTTYFTVPQQTIISPKSCILFSADFNFNKASTDTIRLFDNTSPPTSSSAKLLEQYSYTKAPDTNFSFSTKIDGGPDWQTVESSLGLFNESLVSCIPPPTPTPLSPTTTPAPIPTIIPSVTEGPTAVPTPLPNYQNIFISEVYPYPNVGEQEWIELYNENNFQVDLSHWYIDDIENGGSTPKPISIIIEPYSYGIVYLNTSLFNNDGDSVRLLNSDKVEKDSMEYGKIKKGKSMGRITFFEDSYCEQIPSKGVKNTSCLTAPVSQIIPTNIKSDINFVNSTQKAAIPINTSTSQTRANETVLHNNKSSSSPTSGGEALGIKTTNESNSVSPTPYLSFVSGSYSLLTIVSVFIKMKNA